MKKIVRIIVIAALILIIAVIYTLTEPFLVRVKKVEIVHPDIPSEFNGYTVVFLTDIHRGPYFSEKRMVRLVNRVNRLKPDLVLLGGDYVHRHEKEYVRSCFKVLGQLQSEHGVYAVMGNHDYWAGEELTISEMKKNQINLLKNSGVWIEKDGGRIFIGGVDDLSVGNADIKKTMKPAVDNDFTIIISHNPDIAEQQPLDGVDWMLSGHTHGGQVTLFGLWAPILPSSYGQKYRTGIVKKDDTTILVSNGIGTVTPPVRFFARPQIIYITLSTD